MTQHFAVLLLVSAQAVENDDFNCPSQRGQVIFEDGWVNAVPSDVGQLWPDGTTVDFVCAVNATGRFTDCKFAVRPTDPPMSTAIIRSVEAAMPRIIQYIRSDTPNQRCVASKLKFDFKESTMPS
ncbi:hypothetical protein [Qipengyuania sp. ASV99]|uniref:hypothetical protein n=1 Tax=Qipengyuania sp. ASV99 TaxID=3399681 RepID=UPI003A4C5DBD